MKWFDELSQDDTLALVELLADACGVTAPRIQFNGRRLWRGVYFPSRKLIRVHKRTQVWVVAHEFAHHLDHEHNGLRKLMNDREPHSQGFYYKLRRIIRILDVPDYPWHLEYKQLARWAKRDAGL